MLEFVCLCIVLRQQAVCLQGLHVCHTIAPTVNSLRIVLYLCTVCVRQHVTDWLFLRALLLLLPLELLPGAFVIIILFRKKINVSFLCTRKRLITLCFCCVHHVLLSLKICCRWRADRITGMLLYFFWSLWHLSATNRQRRRLRVPPTGRANVVSRLPS